ncbi:MAG: hypothetical protein H0T93_05695 [Chloroflexia bacterium]|nr:hypothetical protein [Chloroflexia bacterium]
MLTTLQHLFGPAPRRSVRIVGVCLDHIDELVLDVDDRVERIHAALKDGRDVLRTHLPQFLVREVGDVPALVGRPPPVIVPGRSITLGRRDGVMLPIDLDLEDVRVTWSTAEIVERRTDGITIRLTGDHDAISLVTKHTIVASPDHEAILREGGVLVTS